MLTLEKLLEEDIVEMTEYEDYYYILLDKDRYDDTVWKVDKHSGEASYMQYPEYLVTVKDQATKINPESLKGVS